MASADLSSTSYLGASPSTPLAEICGPKPFTAFIKFYADYVITVFGCVSNTLVLVVLLYSKVFSSVTGVFLLSLTISDTLVLLTNQVDNLTRAPIENQRLKLPDFSESWCMALGLLKYASRFAATTIVLAISINRFMVILYPMSYQRFRRAKYATIQVVIIAIVSVFASSYGLGMGWTTCGCRPVIAPKVYTYGVTAVDVIFCDLLASLVIWILSCWTIHVFRLSGLELEHSADSAVTGNRRQSERHMTVLLLTVALTFVLLRLPYTLTWTPLWFMQEFHPRSNSDHTSTMKNLQLASDIMYIFSLLNHAINLYLYCLCSKGFRDEFLRMIRCGPRSDHPSSNMQRKNTTRTMLGK